MDATDTRLHWYITEDSLRWLDNEHTLCGKPTHRFRSQSAHVWQIRHALNADADTCEDCRTFYAQHKPAFDVEEERAGLVAGLMADEGLI